jgi:hypothetical protein
MTKTITSEPAGKRGRNASVILTDRICEKRVVKRVKIYDRKCPGAFWWSCFFALSRLHSQSQRGAGNAVD